MQFGRNDSVHLRRSTSLYDSVKRYLTHYRQYCIHTPCIFMYKHICVYANINHPFVKFVLPLGLLTDTFHMYKSHLRTISRETQFGVCNIRE